MTEVGGRLVTKDKAKSAVQTTNEPLETLHADFQRISMANTSNTPNYRRRIPAFFQPLTLETLTFDNQPRNNARSGPPPSPTQNRSLQRKGTSQVALNRKYVTTFTIQAMLKVLCQHINRDEDQSRHLFDYMYQYLEELGIVSIDCDKDGFEFIRDQYCFLFNHLINSFNQMPSCSQSTDMVVSTVPMANEVLAHSLSVLTKFMPPDWTPMSLLCTSRYKSEFREVKVLGTGGFGKVYKVEYKVDRRFYAIKKIHLHVVNATPLKKVEREVQLMASLQNEHIVRYFTAWWEQGNLSSSSDSLDSLGTSGSTPNAFLEMLERQHPFGLNGKAKKLKGLPVTLLVQMELCETTLKKVLKCKNILCCRDYPAQPMDGVDDEWAKTILYQILMAVEYLHSRSMMHRDLKPANIFLDKSHKFVKLGDFGLARIECFGDADEAATTPLTPFQNYTEKLGTGSYAAPEQLTGSNYDKKADMYSLGIIIFELFYPFGTKMERSKLIEKLRDIKECQPEIDKIKERWPHEAAHIQALLNHDPRLRPNAQDLLSSMSHFKSDKDRIRELSAEIQRKDATIKKLMERLEIQEGQINKLMKQKKKLQRYMYRQSNCISKR